MKLVLSVLSFFFVLLLSFLIAAQTVPEHNKPSIEDISVLHAAPGQKSVEATITGRNLHGLRKLDMGPGILIEQINSVKSNAVRFKFSVAANAAQGSRTIAATTAKGAAKNDELFSVATGRPPIAKIEITPRSGKIGQSFRFDASRSDDPDGKIKTYVWSFGDEGRKTGRIVRHQYRQKGDYKVKLAVTDNAGLKDFATRTLEVRASGSGSNDEGSACKGKNRVRKGERHPDLYGRVIAADRQRKTMVVKLNSPQSCNTAFYKCGDVKKGDGIRTPYEHWYGTICKMEYLGDSTFRLHLVKGYAFPKAGTNDVYLHWQPCARPWCR